MFLGIRTGKEGCRTGEKEGKEKVVLGLLESQRKE
jgi:hypothetical protein